MLLKRYATPVELAHALTLARRLRPALNSFIDYLERTPNYRQRRPASGKSSGTTPKGS